jgi:hypothetical protein
MTRRKVAAATLPMPVETAERTELGRGQYVIWQAGDGGGIVTYRPDGVEEDREQHVPAPFWRIIRAAISGDLAGASRMDLLRMLMGAENGG